MNVQELSQAIPDGKQTSVELTEYALNAIAANRFRSVALVTGRFFYLFIQDRFCKYSCVT